MKFIKTIVMAYYFILFYIILNIKVIFSQTELKLDGIGRGWDYLLDEGRLSAYKITYQNGQTTGGGKYLIPDCASSYIDSFTKYEEWAEIIESGSNYTSSNSKSFGLNAGLSFSKINLSFGFSYSKEYKNIKNTQKNEKSVTVRVQFLSQRYNLLMNRKCPLDDFFISDIQDIAKQVRKNNVDF